MIKFRHFVIVCISGFFIASIIPSCKKDYLVLPENNVPDTVLFSIDIVPLFNESCNTAGCHDGTTTPNLSSNIAYAELFTYGLIDTADAEGSALYTKMTTGNMPPAGKLTQSKTDLVLAWINQGAQNN